MAIKCNLVKAWKLNLDIDHNWCVILVSQWACNYFSFNIKRMRSNLIISRCKSVAKYECVVYRDLIKSDLSYILWIYRITDHRKYHTQLTHIIAWWLLIKCVCISGEKAWNVSVACEWIGLSGWRREGKVWFCIDAWGRCLIKCVRGQVWAFR